MKVNVKESEYQGGWRPEKFVPIFVYIERGIWVSILDIRTFNDLIS